MPMGLPHRHTAPLPTLPEPENTEDIEGMDDTWGREYPETKGAATSLSGVDEAVRFKSPAEKAEHYEKIELKKIGERKGNGSDQDQSLKKTERAVKRATKDAELARKREVYFRRQAMPYNGVPRSAQHTQQLQEAERAREMAENAERDAIAKAELVRQNQRV